MSGSRFWVDRCDVICKYCRGEGVSTRFGGRRGDGERGGG